MFYFRQLTFSVVLGGRILQHVKLDALHSMAAILVWTLLNSAPLLFVKYSYFQQTDCMSSLIISLCRRIIGYMLGTLLGTLLAKNLTYITYIYIYIDR